MARLEDGPAVYTNSLINHQSILIISKV